MKVLNNKKIEFRPHPLVVAIACAMGALLPNTVSSAVPSDLEIYKQPIQGKTSLLLMLDSSAGMDDDGKGSVPRIPTVANGNSAGSIYLDYPECRGKPLKEVATADLDIVYGTQTLNNGTSKSSIAYNIPYCGDSYSPTNLKSSNITTRTNEIAKVKAFKYSRQDRQKIAMAALLGDSSVSSAIRLGLGQMSAQSASNYNIITTSNAQQFPPDGYLISKAAVDGNTAHKEGNDVSSKILVPAQTTTTPLDGDQRYKLRVAVTALGSGGKTPLASALAESGAYMLGTATRNIDGTNVEPNAVAQFTYNGKKYGPYAASGFDYSHIDSKKSTNTTEYQSPIPSDTTSCNSSGIFLLTNAAPTQTPRAIAQTLMRNVLKDQSFTCPLTGSFLPTPNGSPDYGWSCMGEFAKRLYQGTPKVKVAVAGFGNNFIPYLDTGASFSVQLNNSSGKIRTYYKCNALSSYIGKKYKIKAGVYKDLEVDITQDTINACNLGEQANVDSSLNIGGTVGGYGQGGFYPIVSSQDLVDSVKNFVADLETSIPTLNSGIAAIPVDTLNVTQQIPEAYYAQFKPDTTSSQSVGIWVGNMKKYKVVDNTYKAQSDERVIDSDGLLRSNRDYWNDSNEADDANAIKGGALSKLPVQTEIGRKIYSDRTVSGSTASPITTSGAALTLIPSNTTGSNTAESLRAGADPDKAYLLNLLGFGVTTPTPPSNLNGIVQLRQMGATLNSTPLFFTTKSKIATKASGSGVTRVNVGDYIDRKDYVLFGTNQGLLQVVDASTGIEKFAFLPKEMIDRQKNGFVAKSLQTSSNVGSSLYQGIDGAWSVYANYVANNASNSLKASTLNVYGGLRRGGSNFYGLDLKDIETSTPKILFKVGPTSQDTSGYSNGTCNDTNPLNCMGQSWSKPTIAWIKWKGKPQLVMIVGGGYDTRYDSETFMTTTATKGNGIYIFAAEQAKEEDGSVDTTMPESGTLLWWGSSTATGNTANATNDTRKTNNPNLKYSVVSEIKAIDRDSDGFVDNLYFGDLGGQVFRVDIDNASSGTVTTATSSTTKNMVVKRIQRIANFITDAERSTRAAPRFYTMPTFTVHSLSATSTTGATTTSYSLGGVRGNANRFAVISIGSGDVSNPVKNSLSTSNGIPDRIYGIFDRDVGRHDLYANANDSDTTGANATTDGLRSKDITTVNMVDLTAIGTSAPTVENMVAITNHGWYHTLANAGLGRSGTNVDSALTNGIVRYKVLSSFAAIKNTLFTSYFDAADNGSSSSCSAGVKGRSYVKNYCLPFGSMESNGSNCRITETDGRGFSTANTIGSNVGAGIIPVVVGGMTNNQIGPITGVGRDSGVKAAYTTPIRFEPITWYSKRS